ncbi:AbrB/MazE/SpoVT family DNA-binding domain-containing protein [Candidatus Woesearchaeota archaeon]|nr:AbrB/MazE/SpoVT family DNA-binding domain-containing protein [Candidatus Woesearchaeota archaeon]
MAETDLEIKKWGDSLAVIIPKEIVRKVKLRPKDRIHVTLEKEVDLSDIFGIAKGKLKESVQQLKDEAKNGWD